MHIKIIINLIPDSSSVDDIVKSSNVAIEGHPYYLSCEVSGDPVLSVLLDQSQQ